MIISIDDEDDLDSLLLAHNPRFVNYCRSCVSACV